MKKSASYTLRMDADLRAALEAIALDEQRSLANTIEVALRAFVKHRKGS